MSGLDQRYPNALVADALGELERGRNCYERRAWANAYQSLSLADQAAPLEAEQHDCAEQALSPAAGRRATPCRW